MSWTSSSRANSISSAASCKFTIRFITAQGRTCSKLILSRRTYVDLCFVPWEFTAHSFLGDDLKAAGLDAEKKYPNYWAWYQRLLARPSVKKTYGL